MRVLLVVLLLWGAPAFAVGVDSDQLADPAEEARAREIMGELRCLVCQNQSIEDSDAPLAADLRRIVREQVAGGSNEAEIKDYLVERYGDWVLLQPPVKPRTWALWAAPAVALLLGGIVVARLFRSRAA